MFVFNFVFGIVLSISISLYILWNLLAYDKISNSISIELAEHQEYDYIIVGAGTVGSVLTNRLSSINKSISILLIEAGDQFGPLSIVPLLATTLQKTSNDWSFVSVSQKYSSKGLNDQKQFLPRGKGLGGSSQLNYVLHSNGLAKDFDEWHRLGATGWNYKNMKKYLKLIDSDSNDKDLLVKSGKLMTNRLLPTESRLAEVILNAKNEFSIKNQTNIEFRLSESNTLNGCRWSTYHSYLRPSFQRKNLKILYNTRVLKIIFNKNKTATWLKVAPDNQLKQIHYIRAKKEIILSAGAYQTPYILKLSGIGPKNELSSLKINPILIDSPEIGENLYEHMNMPLYVSINETISITQEKIINLKEIWQYLRDGTGLFSRFGMAGFINQENYGVGVFGFGSINEDGFRDLSNVKQEIFRANFPFYYNSSQEGFVLLCHCHQPQSRGRVTLLNRNPKYLPNIDPNYLSNPNDIDCMRKSIRLAAKIINSKAFQIIGSQIHWPKLRECRNFGPFRRRNEDNNNYYLEEENDFINDRYLECIIRYLAVTSHHPGGTCSMGDSEISPLDSQLRVRGVNGLRVADASILPAPVSGTPNSILVAVAERAADLIISTIN